MVRAGNQMEQTMRQRAAHRAYVGSRAVLSLHGQNSACRSTGRRPGFTLVEVVVAFAIMFILVLGLSAGFAYSQRVFRQSQLSAMSQNLMDLQVEDLRSLSADSLAALVSGSYDAALVNYPHYQDAASHVPAQSYQYDQTLDGDTTTNGVFYFINLVDKVVLLRAAIPVTYTAPQTLGSDVLLGSSVSVVVDSTSSPSSYYSVLFYRDMYPTLARRIHVAQVSGGAAGSTDYVYEYSVAILTPTSSGYTVIQELSGIMAPLATQAGG